MILRFRPRLTFGVILKKTAADGLRYYTGNVFVKLRDLKVSLYLYQNKHKIIKSLFYTHLYIHISMTDDKTFYTYGGECQSRRCGKCFNLIKHIKDKFRSRVFISFFISGIAYFLHLRQPTHFVNITFLKCDTCSRVVWQRLHLADPPYSCVRYSPIRSTC